MGKRQSLPFNPEEFRQSRLQFLWAAFLTFVQSDERGCLQFTPEQREELWEAWEMAQRVIANVKITRAPKS